MALPVSTNFPMLWEQELEVHIAVIQKRLPARHVGKEVAPK